MEKKQFNFEHCPKEGRGMQPEYKAFKELFKTLVWIFSEEEGGG